MSIFDEAGNLITKKPESDKVIPEKEVFCCQYCDKEWDKKISKSQHESWCNKNPNKRVIPEKEVFCCQYCDKEWDKKVSKTQHERWCNKNPNKREYRKTESVKKPKEKAQIKSKTKIPEGIDIIKELRNFDKIFGLTDEQIIKYIRGLTDKQIIKYIRDKIEKKEKDSKKDPIYK